MDQNLLNVIVVDDEPDAVDLLSELLKRSSYVGAIYTASCVDEALPRILRFKPDMVFLDVEMPTKDGFGLVEELNKLFVKIDVVFTTAFEKYAIKAIRSSAMDYLLKPIDPKELESVLKKAISKKAATTPLNNENNGAQTSAPDYKPLRINTRNGFMLFDPDEIFFIEADWNYTHLSLISGESCMATMNLGTIEKILPTNQFFRVNRSTLINLHYLKMVDRKLSQCKLQFGVHEKSFVVSKQRLKELETRFSE